jgi:hypothetical protein
MTPISEREIGVIEQKINNLEHRVRNDKMVVTLLVDEVSLLRLELTQFKYRAYGISSAILVLLGGLSLIIDFLKGV